MFFSAAQEAISQSAPMSDPASSASSSHSTPGRIIKRLCEAFALVGGLILVGVTLMSAWSIVGRAFFNQPLQGDYELVQAGVAVFVGMCLPYCQWQRANIIVDFFTTRTSPAIKARLDALGALLLGLVMLLVGWRTVVGLIDIRASGETGTILGLPTWYTYAGIFPGIFLTAVTALYTAARHWRARRTKAAPVGRL